MAALPQLPSPTAIPAVHRVDEAVAAWMVRIERPWLDRVAYGLSSAADHSLLWNAAVALRAVQRRDPRVIARGAAVLALESGLTNGGIKALFARERPEARHGPDEALPMGMRRPVTSSFPSGHATAAFTAAALLSKGTRQAPLWYSLATVVAATRVYTRMHHLSDVVAGAALGAALGAAANRVLPLDGRARRR